MYDPERSFGHPDPFAQDVDAHDRVGGRSPPPDCREVEAFRGRPLGDEPYPYLWHGPIFGPAPSVRCRCVSG